MPKFKRIRKQVIKKADAILTADWHIRPDIPICRTDNFLIAMEKKIDFILDLSKEHNCPVLEAGDLGNKSQWPNWLLKWAINKFEGHSIIVVPGQHDLLNHRLDLWKKSGIGVLHAAGVIPLLGPHDLQSDLRTETFHLDAFPYGEELHSIQPQTDLKIPRIAMAHQMVIENKPLWPGQEAPKGHQLLKKYPEYSLILSGDNHTPFVAEYKGRLLVNPGSLMRTIAAQIEHKPRVYLWYADENKVEVVYLPIEHNVISREHIETTDQRSKRMDAYLERMKQDVEIQLSYPKNMEAYFAKHRTQPIVKNKVWEAIE